MATGDIFSLAFFIAMAALTLYVTRDKQGKTKDGKWKRIRVKKDTTIHVMEETEG